MPPILTPQRERYLLLTLAGMQFSHILDFMIMMPLGPILMREFGISTHEFGLLVASYSFSAAFSGLLAATFVDRFERKRLLLITFVLFGLASLACGFAPSYATLLTVLFVIIGQQALPQLRHHISAQKRAHPFVPMFDVLRDPNHRRALIF